MATALIARQQHPLQRTRAEAERRLCTRGALQLWRGSVRSSNRALVRYLLQKVVSKHLKRMKCVAQWPDLDPADPKIMISVRSTLSNVADGLEMLP